MDGFRGFRASEFGDLGIGPAVVTGGPFGKRHADIVDHMARQAGGDAGEEIEVLIVLAMFAAADAGLKEAEMPSGRHGTVFENASEEFEVARDEKASLGWRFRQIADGLNEQIIHPFIGIEVELPGIADRERIDSPVALGAVIFKIVPINLGAHAAGDLGGIVCAERIDNKDIIRDGESAFEGGREGFRRVKREDDDGGFHAET